MTSHADKSQSKEVIHDIIFLFTARRPISFTWPLSCGIYLSSVLLNIVMICINVQEWNDSVGQRLSSAQHRCLGISRQAWTLWNKIKPLFIVLFNLQAKLKATDDEPWLSKTSLKHLCDWNNWNGTGRKSNNSVQALSLSICLFSSCVGNEQRNRTRSVVMYAQERIKDPFILPWYAWTFVSFFGINIIFVLNSTATCLCLNFRLKKLMFVKKRKTRNALIH